MPACIGNEASIFFVFRLIRFSDLPLMQRLFKKSIVLEQNADAFTMMDAADGLEVWSGQQMQVASSTKFRRI
jgi:hypothetical protein